ncbi:MAG: hypothetical protein CL910_06510 [Deltaproteobacteria bacterium]|nr:hypothetical protein [Deltaproteobacteria bacterium]
MGWLGLVFVLACGGDGPTAMFPGGPLTSGEWIEETEVDWSFASEIEEIELQSGGSSRTTWIAVIGEQAFVPCSLEFPPFKTWHEDALTDPSAVVRVGGKRYRRTLQKVEDAQLQAELEALVEEKYGGSPGDGGVWFFLLASPAG